MKISRAINLVVLIIFAFLMYWAAVNYHLILDYVAYNATAPGSVAEAYSKNLQLTESGKLILYGTYPQIDSKAEFNNDCQPGPNVLEFGCYYGIKNKIYLLDIKEPNLTTMINVGAGHEMLHAVYARLTPKEKTVIDKMVEESYSKIKDPDLETRLKSYDKTEPGNRNNELHSILATEYPSLSAPLEAHYRKYFINREAIVAWHQQNEAYIGGKEQSVISQKQKIEAEKATLDQLDAYMDKLRLAKKISEFNALVRQQNNLVTSLRAEIENYNQNVASYNELIASLNSHTYSSFDAALIK